MRSLRTFREIIRENEYAGLCRKVSEGVPAEVIQAISLKERNSALIHVPLHFDHDLEVRKFVSAYEYESRSILGFDFLDQSGQIEVSLCAGEVYHPFFSDLFDNCYLLSEVDSHLSFYGWDWLPEDMLPIAIGFSKFLRVVDSYQWEEFPNLPNEEFEEICNFLGTDQGNFYWRTLRTTGTTAHVQMPSQKP